MSKIKCIALKLKIYKHNPMVIAAFLATLLIQSIIIIKKPIIILQMNNLVLIVPIAIMALYMVCIYDEYTSGIIKLEYSYLDSRAIYICDWLIYNGIVVLTSFLVIMTYIFCVKVTDIEIIHVFAALFVLAVYSNIQFGVLKLFTGINGTFFVSGLIMLFFHLVAGEFFLLPITNYIGEIQKNINYMEKLQLYSTETMGYPIEMCTQEICDESSIIYLAVYMFVINGVAIVLSRKHNQYYK